MEVAREFASKPPIAFALAKASFAQGMDSLDASLRNEVDYQALLGTTEDHHEATTAFLEKRKPKFSGK